MQLETVMLQTDHHAIGQLSTGKPEQSLAVQAQGAPTCEDCSAANRVVANFRQRLEVLEAANAVRDSKQAQSLPSTQDHSGDTNDDRYANAKSAAALQITLSFLELQNVATGQLRCGHKPSAAPLFLFNMPFAFMQSID